MKKVRLTIFLLLIVLTLVGCNNSIPDNTHISEYISTTEQTNEEPFEDCVEYCDAINHIGENITVYGDVDSTYYAFNSNGSPTFINIGKPFGDSTRCTVVIWGKDRSKFNSPETLYDGKKIKVTGTVEIYEGVAQIKVSSPSQIEIFE